MAGSILKRVKVSRMQQEMMLIVLVASLVFGISLVFSIYFIKLMIFNTKVADAKDVSIQNYYSVISSVGICEDKDGNKQYSDAELKACNPDALDVNNLTGTLRNKVLVDLANNVALESVARGSLEDCYKIDGDKKTKINWVEEYQKSQVEEERLQAIEKMKRCSALRVIPDALPAQHNEEALLSSLNQIFIISDWEPEALSPGGSTARSPIAGLSVIPVNLMIEADTQKTHSILANIERSIREFDITVATISWTSDEETGASSLTLEGQANAYYSAEKVAQEETMFVYASDSAKKKQREAK